MSVGTKEDPWELTTAPGSSAYLMWREPESDPPALVCQVGSTTLKYRLGAIDDLAEWLGYRGRFGMYLPPLLEELGLVELTHDKRNNRVRAIISTT